MRFMINQLVKDWAADDSRDKSDYTSAIDAGKEYVNQ